MRPVDQALISSAVGLVQFTHTEQSPLTVFTGDIGTVEQNGSVEHQVVVPDSDFGKTNQVFPPQAHCSV